ncbi:helix-turn-helix transcriptional regulator [Agrobacterium sp. LC34]|jgi:DNA-binding CsgD family transcriptional regulator|uniref:Helix-turn-helix transcriptional regulator n=4 Tax=Rhizobium/Agrobacterium group TaxID=227290 RepID=A0AAE6BJX0_AGRTU|nr:helix-turn-helix transcriptional regulator [Agrobacterium tumefaciens]QCL98843.1 helix-turn-helix transcriptional regulator [Agrobacterium tumefaciens]TKT67291.1 helix-turn-helix transcriptional regulator [Agrobacterium sp. LC34]TRB00527.1 helix-turn-helix transcriptional regulator [Rhizobium rhizogenes]CUX34022.1 DNA-binding protein with HTH domain [Agrobacterium tomkonis CFBP 6623]
MVGRMVQTKDNEGTGQTGMFYRSPVATSRSDLFPKLVAMQKLVGARNFVVTKAAASGFPNKKKLTCELENWGMNAAEQSTQFIRAVGDILLDHIETSLLPVIWRNKNAGGFADLPDVPALLRRIENDTLPYAGLAMPVRLGTIGNGYIVFCGTNLVLDNEVVIEQHIKCCEIMVDMLALDERKAAPSEALSEREIACLQLAGDGRISEEIAVKLGLSVHTVNAYLGSATIKLDSVNRIQAIAKAIRLGYIH